MDREGEHDCRILLYDERDRSKRVVHAEDWICPAHELRVQLIRAGAPREKRYDMSAHPVFSPDGRRMVFNSCADGVLRVKEIERSGDA